MARTGQLPRIRLDRVELAMVLMAVSNSIVPLLWMTIRQEAISQDDLLYSLVLWKLLGIYVIVRFAVTTDLQVRRCLWLSVAAASLVALVAILQSLSLFGVPRLLAEFFGGPTEFGPPGGRGSSTLGLPAATADLMVFNLAIVAGLWTRYRRHGLALAVAALLMLFGALSAGEFAGAIGLVVGVICIAIVSGSPRMLAWFVPAAAVGGYVLWPVLSIRLCGFQSASGLPQSWLGRLNNLETYFWPRLFSDWNFLLGVEPSARIAIVSYSGNYVWIESGYTWLLWGGGIPLLASFLVLHLCDGEEGLASGMGSRRRAERGRHRGLRGSHRHRRANGLRPAPDLSGLSGRILLPDRAGGASVSASRPDRVATGHAATDHAATDHAATHHTATDHAQLSWMRGDLHDIS